MNWLGNNIDSSGHLRKLAITRHIVDELEEPQHALVCHRHDAFHHLVLACGVAIAAKVLTAAQWSLKGLTGLDVRSSALLDATLAARLL